MNTGQRMSAAIVGTGAVLIALNFLISSERQPRAVANVELPGGACCFPDGSCTNNGAENICILQGGQWQGNGTHCDFACPGACCLPDGSCVEATTFGDCVDQSGLPQGLGTVCGSVNCPQPGACCLPDGTCFIVSELGGADCTVAGGIYQGDDSDCSSPCSGACCLPNGQCPILFEADCVAQGGLYHGDGVSPCPPDSPCLILGACCRPSDGTCLILSEPNCVNQQLGEWMGPDSDCSDANFNGNPDVCENTCPPDIDGDGVVAVSDLLILLAAWGACQ